MNASSRMRESMEAGDFQSSMFNMLKFTYEIQQDLDLEI